MHGPAAAVFAAFQAGDCAGFEVDHGFVLVAGDQARHHFRHERQVADDDGVLSPAVDGGEQRVGGIIGRQAGLDLFDDVAGTEHLGQQQCRFQGAQFARMDDPGRGDVAAGQKRRHLLDVVAAAVA